MLIRTTSGDKSLFNQLTRKGASINLHSFCCEGSYGLRNGVCMAIISGDTVCKIIDRTFMNCYREDRDRQLLTDLMEGLNHLGVDYHEVDRTNAAAALAFIPVEKLIFHAYEKEDIEYCSALKVKGLILDNRWMCDEDDDFDSALGNGNSFVEVILDRCIDKINPRALQIAALHPGKITALRYIGLQTCFFDVALGQKYSVGIYADDRWHMATAAAVQGIKEGAAFLTTSFCGRDGSFGTTSLEQLTAYAQLIMESKLTGDLVLLHQVKEVYERLMMIKVKGNQPVIGEAIFKYESGVHAAGIQKAPVTYEPFMPECVGLKRKMALGKHSGKNSIRQKLHELKIAVKYSEQQLAEVLMEVKQRSIRNKTELSDSEFIEILRKAGGPVEFEDCGYNPQGRGADGRSRAELPG